MAEESVDETAAAIAGPSTASYKSRTPAATARNLYPPVGLGGPMAEGNLERTLVLIKPDGVRRGLVGEVVHRFERKGLKILAAKTLRVTPELAQRHYAEHQGKPFFAELVEFITSGPLAAMVLEGESVVAAARQGIGATDPLQAAPGSIRGDFAIAIGTNMVHGSDSPESAARETGIFFPEL